MRVRTLARMRGSPRARIGARTGLAGFAALWAVLATAAWGQGSGLPEGAPAGSPGPDSTEADAPDGQLQIVNLDLLDSRDGYAIPRDSTFLPGDSIHVFFQIKGYGVGEEYRVALKYVLEALDPAGRRFYMSEGGEFDVELAPQDDNWMPAVHYSPRIPEHAGGGSYAIRIAVTDEIAQDAAEVTLPITVDGERVALADELQIRDFEFAASEGGAALDEPAYQSGDRVWASFYITGYALREDNTYGIESSARVIDAKGATLYDFEPQADAGNPDYPRLWLPAKLRVDLDDNIPPGIYTVVLELQDEVGDASATRRYPFRIR